jgi:hypothetical protein
LPLNRLHPLFLHLSSLSKPLYRARASNARISLADPRLSLELKFIG